MIFVGIPQCVYPLNMPSREWEFIAENKTQRRTYMPGEFQKLMAWMARGREGFKEFEAYLCHGEGLDLNINDLTSVESKDTLLTAACHESRHSFAKILLEDCNADPLIPDSNGRLPLEILAACPFVSRPVCDLILAVYKKKNIDIPKSIFEKAKERLKHSHVNKHNNNEALSTILQQAKTPTANNTTMSSAAAAPATQVEYQPGSAESMLLYLRNAKRPRVEDGAASSSRSDIVTQSAPEIIDVEAEIAAEEARIAAQTARLNQLKQQKEALLKRIHTAGEDVIHDTEAELKFYRDTNISGIMNMFAELRKATLESTTKLNGLTGTKSVADSYAKYPDPLPHAVIETSAKQVGALHEFAAQVKALDEIVTNLTYGSQLPPAAAASAVTLPYQNVATLAKLKHS
jgi:hypothetical protein